MPVIRCPHKTGNASCYIVQSPRLNGCLPQRRHDGKKGFQLYHFLYFRLGFDMHYRLISSQQVRPSL